MLLPTLDQFSEWFIQYKYFVIFPAAVVEGPIVCIICGFLVSLKLLNPELVYVVLVVADLVGDSFFYTLGRFGGTRFVNHFGHYVGATKERVEGLEKHFKNHTNKTIIISKLTNFTAIFVLVAAGLVKMPYWRFLWINFIVTLPKSLALLVIGFFFGHAYNTFGSYIDTTGLIVFLFVAIGIIIYLFVKKSKKHENSDCH